MAEITSIATQNPLSIKPTDQLTQVIEFMTKKGFRRLPVVWDYELVGIITAKDIIRVLQSGKTDVLESEVHNFMTTQPDLLYVFRDTPTTEAIKIMFDNGIGGLPILSSTDGSLSGIITERDLVKAFVDSIADADLDGFINYDPPQLLYNKATVNDVINAMVEADSSRLILINTKQKVKGILTTKDLLRYLNNEIIKYGKTPEGILKIKAIDIAVTDVHTRLLRV